LKKQTDCTYRREQARLPDPELITVERLILNERLSNLEQLFK